MPDFKAAAPEAKPLACVIHGNSLSCPGALECSGVIRPAQPAPSLSVQPAKPAGATVANLEQARALVAGLDDDELELLLDAAHVEEQRRWDVSRTAVKP